MMNYIKEKFKLITDNRKSTRRTKTDIVEGAKSVAT